MKILIAVDGSAAALEAAQHALQLARDGLRTEFVLATVQDPTYLYELMLAPDANALERVTGAVGSRALAGAEALFQKAGMAYQREIASGDPAVALIEVAHRYGCTAIAYRSKHVLERSLLHGLGLFWPDAGRYLAFDPAWHVDLH